MTTTHKLISSHRFAAAVLAALFSSAAFSSLTGGEKGLTLRMVRMKGYSSQDSIRDSLRYALCETHDDGLSFWAREYPINGEFYDRASIKESRILDDRPPLRYKLWMRTEKAPLVVVLPGMGGHYQGTGVNALAQTYFDGGCSVLIVSSAMNWEFYLAACSSKVPGYAPLDAEDIRRALSRITADVRREHPGRVSSMHLVGISLGAAHALFVAKLESEAKKKIGFASYLAIHPPVDMLGALSTLDAYFDKWRDWPKDKLSREIEKAVAVYLALSKKGLPPNKKVAIDKKAGEVLIALSYRYALRELLLAIKTKGNDMGLIKTPDGFTKNELYKELDAISFKEYADKFLRKSVGFKLAKTLSLREIADKSSLRSITPFLRNARNVRVIGSMNDFILRKRDFKWFAGTFGDRALFFEYGGHLGELYTKQAKIAVVEYLTTVEKPSNR